MHGWLQIGKLFHRWCFVRSQAEAAVSGNLPRLQCSSVPAPSVWLKFLCRKGSSAEPRCTSCNPWPLPCVRIGSWAPEDSPTDTKSCGRPEREGRKELQECHGGTAGSTLATVPLSEPLVYREWHSSLAQARSGRTWLYFHCSAVPSSPRLPEERGPEWLSARVLCASSASWECSSLPSVKTQCGLIPIKLLCSGPQAHLYMDRTPSTCPGVHWHCFGLNTDSHRFTSTHLSALLTLALLKSYTCVHTWAGPAVALFSEGDLWNLFWSLDLKHSPHQSQ